MRREWLIFAIILCIIFTSSLSASADRLSVYVVNYPLKYFAERIAGEHATVILPTLAGTDPAFWMPDAKDEEKTIPRIIANINHSRLITAPCDSILAAESRDSLNS